MLKGKYLLILITILSVIFFFSNCDTQQSVGIQESLDVIPELTLIEGGENASITVNRGSDSYFTLDVDNVESSSEFNRSSGKAWCIAWNQPIDSNNSRYDGIKLYSTYGSEHWKPINYFLSIKDELKNDDPSLTFKEFQIVIWSLLDFPEFDLNNITIENLPSRLVENGQYTFEKSKVDEILSRIRSNYRSFEYSSINSAAVIAETDSDTQTVIIEPENNIIEYSGSGYNTAITSTNGEVQILTEIIENNSTEELQIDLTITDENNDPLSGMDVYFAQEQNILEINIFDPSKNYAPIFFLGNSEQLDSFVNNATNTTAKTISTQSNNSSSLLIEPIIISGILITAIVVKWGFDHVNDIWNVSRHFFHDVTEVGDDFFVQCMTMEEYGQLLVDQANASTTNTGLFVGMIAYAAPLTVGQELFISGSDFAVSEIVSDLTTFALENEFSTRNEIEDGKKFGIKFYPEGTGTRNLFVRSEILFGYPNCEESGSSDWPRDTTTEIVDVYNPATGQTWMDRNLGASRAATSPTDEQAYGDLYQWGRAADGHEKRNSGITSTLSNTDTPGHDDFISPRSEPRDWRSPQNDNLWKGVNGVNNPCPDGYRLPTNAEWEKERQSWYSNDADGAFASPLKLPLPGHRHRSTARISAVGTNGFYWSSTHYGVGSSRLVFDSIDAFISNFYRADARSIRCIKD